MASSPKYITIRDELKTKILSGELTIGERIPSEFELCDLYNISRISAKRVLNELENDGYVRRVVGKGTFVSYDPIVHEIGGYYSLSGEIRKHGEVPSSKLICFEKIPVSQCFSFDVVGLKMFLNLLDEDLVYHISCQRFRSGEIIAFDNTYLPVKYFPDITQEDIVGDSAVYRIITQKYHYGPVRAWERYFARLANEEEALYLGVTPHSPALKVMRISTAQGKGMIYNWRVYKGEEFHLTVDLGERTEE